MCDHFFVDKKKNKVTNGIHQVYVLFLQPSGYLGLSLCFLCSAGSTYLLQFASPWAEGAIKTVILRGLSAQRSARLSEHGTLLQQTVPLRDREAQGVPAWWMDRKWERKQHGGARKDNSRAHETLHSQILDRGAEVVRAAVVALVSGGRRRRRVLQPLQPAVLCVQQHICYGLWRGNVWQRERRDELISGVIGFKFMFNLIKRGNWRKNWQAPKLIFPPFCTTVTFIS